MFIDDYILENECVPYTTNRHSQIETQNVRYVNLVNIVSFTKSWMDTPDTKRQMKKEPNERWTNRQAYT